MRIFTLISLSFFAVCSEADTMDHYMSIANQIPQMEMKADAKAQSWARSARTVLDLTHESILETISQANELARTQGKPFYCAPVTANLSATKLGNLIAETYHSISSQPSDKNKMTVSQVAWLAVTKTYPCNATKTNNNLAATLNESKNLNIQHMDAILGR